MRSLPALNPIGDLEQELLQLQTLAEMLYEFDVRLDAERISYLKDRVADHAGRARRAFTKLHAEHLALRAAAKQHAHE